MRFVLICLGGALGTGLRYLVSGGMAAWLGPWFPYGTFAVNLMGCFAVGVIQEIGTTTLLLSDTTRLSLTIGLLGGMTTYSSFSYETVRLMEGGAWHQAWLNVVLTTALCLGGTLVGMALVRAFVGLRGGP